MIGYTLLVLIALFVVVVGFIVVFAAARGWKAEAKLKQKSQPETP